MTRHQWILAPIIAAALVWSATAHGDIAGAKAAFKKGEAAYKAGHYEAALTDYLRAYKEKPLNGFHFNLGLCYRKLGKHDDAIKHFKAYLEGSSSEANRARARELIKLSEADRDRARRARDVIPPTKTPPRKTDETPPDLNKAPAKTPPPAKKKPVVARRRRGWSPVWFWTGVGLTSAAVVIGSITGGVALSKSSDFTNKSTSIPERQKLYDSGVPLKNASTAMFIAAGVFAAATITAYLFTDFSGGESKSSISAAPTRGGVFVAWDARF